jgi:hypothetical protein
VPQAFSTAELEELRYLLGLYGVDTAQRLPPGRATAAYVGERQGAWNEVRLRAREPARRHLAERAVARYGILLGELTRPSPPDPV